MADQPQIHRTLPPASQVEETFDAAHGIASISSLVSRCFRDFQDLLGALSSEDEHSSARSKVGEELGRLRVWAGNFGAHRKQTDRLSLDHRLREAPDLHRGVRNHLNDLSDTINEASIHLSTNPESTGKSNVQDGEDSDSESSDSDGFWEQIKTEGNRRSLIDVYVDDLSHAVTSLYKLSLSLQNPAHRDRSAQASRIDLRHFEFYDIHHVCDKFKLTPDSNLAQRLGRANTKRRQLLAYYKDHSDKISKYIDVTLTKAVPAPQLPMKIEIQSEYQQKPPTISTQWTQDTTVSTIYQNIEVASDSGRTKFSAATSTMGDQDKIEIAVPPPPSASSVTRRDPFICPYCHQTVQVENDEDWIYHVYSDLRPYICTFGGCVKENQLYDSFTEWSAHERQFHRREWFCTLCPYTSGEKSSFINHLDDHHTNISNEQRQEMENQSKSSTLAQQCPLCTKPPMSNSGRFQQHLARHLQQLALFALPRGKADDEDSAAREQESNESQKALVMDVEDRESINSIPIDDEASMAESSISGLLSPIDDRLMDAIPQETIKHPSWDVGSEADYSIYRSDSALWDRPSPTLTFPTYSSKYLQMMNDTSENIGDESEAAREGESNESQQASVMGEEERESIHSISIDDEASMAESSISGLLSSIDDRLVGVMPQEPLLFPPEYIGDDLEGTSIVNSMDRSPATLPKRAVDAIALLEHSQNNLGPEHPNTMTYLENVVEVFWQQGLLRELEPFLNELLDLKQKHLGPKSVSTLASMDTKGQMLYQSQRYAEAEEVQTEVVQIRKQIWGMENHHTLNSMHWLVRTYTALEKFDESEELALQLIEHTKRSSGENDPVTLFSIRARAFNSLRRGDYRKGEELLLHIVEVSEKHQDYPALREAGELAAIDLAGAYFDNGEPERAEAMFDKILMSLRTGAGTDDARNRLLITGQIADVYLAHGRLDNAENLIKEALKNATEAYGSLNSHRVYYEAQLARVFWQKGKIVEARELMAECADDLLKLLGPQSPDTADAFKVLKELEISVESKNADK